MSIRMMDRRPVLARDKQIPDEVRSRLLRKASELGIDVSELIWVEHDRNDA